MNRKLLVLLTVSLIITAILTGCNSGTTGVSDNDKLIIKVGHAAAETTAKHIGWLNFKELLEEKSDGKIQVEIYPNQQLGSDRELVEAVQIGNINMCSVSSAPLASFKNDFFSLDIPFLFKDREMVYKVLDGPEGRELLDSLEDIQLKGLGYWENGFRNLTNSNVPIKKPDDLIGMKVRTMENEIHLATWKLLGANPTPMAFGEVFTALQQKTIDGQENPSELIYNTRFHEVQNYLTKTGHIYSPYVILINKEFFQTLSHEYQKFIEEAVAESTDMQREKAKKKEREAEKGMKTHLKIIELTDEEKIAFRKKTEAVYDVVRDKAGEKIVNKLLEATK